MSKLIIFIPLLAACNESAADRARPPVEPAAKLAFVAAIDAPTPEILTLTGKIVADQRAEITADTQGKVIAVMVERGERVKRGQPVVQLDVRSAALSTTEAAAHLEAARTDQQLAQIECGRTRTLFDKGAISRSELDRQTAQCASSTQQVTAARARTQMLAKSVSDGIVRAPFDGIVSQRDVTVGDWVSPGRPLFTLVDNDPLKLELSVPEASVPAIALGQEIAVTTVSRPGTSYHATITRLAAEIGRTRSLIVEATVESTPHLVPGMFVEAQVVTGHVTRPVIPATAVVKRGKTWHAFVVKQGALEDRIIQLGPVPAPGKVSIVQNITKGDRVVATVTETIADGLRVE
jgi:membrane fusion protein (multidrug efflux system)